MSTYYGFKCDGCDRTGGFFSRQMWGWGNFDIIESFKFLAYHTRECGHEKLRVVSEHDELYGDETLEEKREQRKQFLKDAADIFPHSNDWGFIQETPRRFKEKWNVRELREIQEEEAVYERWEKERCRCEGSIEKCDHSKHGHVASFGEIRTLDGQIVSTHSDPSWQCLGCGMPLSGIGEKNAPGKAL